MKKIKITLLILLCLLVLSLVGCAKKGFSDGGRMPSYYSSDVVSKEVGADGDLEWSEEGHDDSKNQERISPGQLTVCAYDDNAKWEYYQSLITRGQEEGAFFYYQEKYKLANNRIKLTIKDKVIAKISLLNDNDEVEFTTFSDNFGNAYLFNSEKRDTYKVKVTYTKDNEQVEKVLEVSDNGELDLETEKKNNSVMQLMFVIDTTGSMGDEITYLQSEVKDVIQRIKSQNDNITIYLAIMVYRDHGDDYVTKYFDFTTDIDAQIANLSKEHADGGGDFEEAVDEAFTKAATCQWLTNSSTNVLIHIADAPSHDSDVNKWFNAVNKLASQNVKIINVASSGIDKATEYLFRNECIRTGGYYCYLTNDSGIGGDHIEATVEEKPTVEYLNECLIRLISGIHTGVLEEAKAYKSNQQ